MRPVWLGRVVEISTPYTPTLKLPHTKIFLCKRSREVEAVEICTPLPSQARPSLAAWSLVGIVGRGLVRFASLRHIPHRLIASHGDNLTASGCAASAGLRQVAAQIADPKVVKRPED
jgi:hypothetical protein